MNSARPEIRQRLNRMLNVGILAPKHARPKPSTPDGNIAAERGMMAGVAVIELRRPPDVKSDIGEILSSTYGNSNGREVSSLVCPKGKNTEAQKSDDGHDSHKIRHGFFKWLRQIELATNASSSERVGSIYFATLFEIMVTWRFLYKPPIINELQITLDGRE